MRISGGSIWLTGSSPSSDGHHSAFLVGILEAPGCHWCPAMIYSKNGYTCPTCGHESQGNTCSLCDAPWNCWELMFALIPIEELRKQVAVWIGQLPQPFMFEIAALSTGVRLRMYAPNDVSIQPVLDSFAAMTSHQMRWRSIEPRAVQSPRSDCVWMRMSR